MQNTSRVRNKGAFIRKKELERREKVRQVVKARRSKEHQASVDEKRSVSMEIEGCRIIDVSTLIKNFECSFCNEDLHMKNIKNEAIKGVHATFMIECQFCHRLTAVDSGKYHKLNDTAKSYVPDKKHNNLTSNAVLGALYAGVGCTQLNKILACLDVPTISDKLYKKYEREVGPAIEEAARRSCRIAAFEERKLVLQKADQLRQQL